jgi:hypothetical protein
MTQKEAKELSLELWTYLAEHPECYARDRVPDELYSKVKMIEGFCPLCAVFDNCFCTGCPLKIARCKCIGEDSPWSEWVNSSIKETDRRKQAAERIVQIVSAWDPEDAGNECQKEKQ